MRKLLLTFGLFVLVTLTIKAQQTIPAQAKRTTLVEIYIDENFNGDTLPANWVNANISGTQTWEVKLDGSDADGVASGSFPGEAGENNIDGTSFLVFDDDSLGQNVLNNTPAIETPTFDNSALAGTYLEFDYNFRSVTPVVPSVLDSFYVEAWDGSSWNLVFSVKDDDCGQYFDEFAPIPCLTDGFPHAKVDISAYKNANCKVRFVYHDGGDWAFYVGVDNIKIYSPQDKDLNAGKVVSPVSDCGLSDSEIVQVMVHNTGGEEVKQFDVRLDINEGSQIVTESFTDTIPPQDSAIVEFVSTVDFSSPQIYNVEVAVTLASDTLNTNDTTITIIDNDTVYSSVYYSSFEGIEDEWISGGDSMQFERGYPTGRVISSARRGNFAWVTRLDEYHADFDLKGSTITSPCFDFSEALGDPIFSFDLYTHLADGNDLLRLQTSIDNGQTWQEVERSGISSYWYNNSKRTGWTSNSGGWRKVENVLKGLAGESQVSLRFIFTSDGFNLANPTRHDGVAIDGFRIELPDSLDLVLKELQYPIQGEGPECGYGSEIVSIRVENRGATDVETFVIGYQIDTEPVVKDTITTTIPVNNGRTYFFNELGDFSQQGRTYRLAVWVEALGDGATHNDTIANIRIDNDGPNNNITPLKANFDNWIPGSTINNEDDRIGDGWIRTSPGANTTWRVANSGDFTDINTGPNANHTIGNPLGNFMYIETSEGDSGQFAVLETPCVDFSQKSAAQLDFWFYRYGAVMGNLIIEVFDGTDWVDSVEVITVKPQNNKDSEWTPRSVDLTAFAGKKIKIRFKGQKLTHTGLGGNQGDIAIDDVILYEPSPNDVEFIRFVSPISDCNIGPNSNIGVQFMNFGTDTIPADSLILTCVYYPKDEPFEADTLMDTVRIPIPPKDTIDNYIFSQKANIVGNGVTYRFNTWSTLSSDANFGNDSLFNYEATNFTQSPGYIENFESFAFIEGNCRNHYDDDVGGGWSTGNSNFNWNVQNARTCLGPNGATPTLGTGPAGDHTTGEGKFFYTESSLTGGVAELTSPCIDFSQSTGAAMAFWYHMYGDQMSELYIDVLANGVWNLGVDQIIGEQQLGIDEAWRLKGVNLGAFAGELIQVRFRAIRRGGTGDIAIDDIEFFEPIPQDARVTEVFTPITECSPAGVVKIALENFGLDTIVGSKVVVNFRANGGPIFSDTIHRGIGIGDSIHHTFTSLGSFTRVNTLYTLLAWTELENDSNVFNDTLTYRFRNITQSPAYTENFESFRDGGCNAIGDLFTRGWESDPSQLQVPTQAHWAVQNAAACGGTGPQGIGPQADGTSGRGNFMFLRTAGVVGNTANLITPCIDFTNDTTAGLLFNYHIMGTGNAKLYIDILTDTGFAYGVDSLFGNHQVFNSDNWIEYAVKLEEFAGQEIQIYFRGVTSANNDVIAIDDIGFYYPQDRDARMLQVLTPVSGCDLFENSVVTVQMENFGTKEFPRDSVFVFYQVGNNPPVGEKVRYDTVYNGTVIDTVYKMLAVDSSYTHVFDQTADLSSNGDVYNIKTWTSLRGEQNVDNDTLFTYTIYNETRTTNFFEDFEGFKDANCAEIVGQATNNGWTIYSTAGYSWHVQSSLCGKNDGVTPTFETGPNGDHTKGDGMFLYADASTSADGPVGGIAYFESSCIDIATNTKTHLSYYYYRYGEHVGSLWTEVYLDSTIYDKAGFRAVKKLISANFIDSSDYDQYIIPSHPTDPDSAKNFKIDSTINTFFNNWRQVGSTVSGAPLNAEDLNWQHRIVDLSPYVGQRIKLRFVSSAGAGIRGDIAIDDILLYEPSTVDVGVINVLQPDFDGCAAGERIVIAEVTNLGLDKIDAGNVALEYIIRGDVTRDTLRQDLDSGESINYAFAKRLDLSNYSGVQNVVVNAVLNGDTIGRNNSSYREVVNRQPAFPRYFSDFENHSTDYTTEVARNYALDDMQGWRRSVIPVAPGIYGWHVECGPAPNNPAALFNPPGPPTGPSGDHTYAVTERNGDGCYLLVESAVRPAPFNMDDAWVELPCGAIDFTKSKNKQVLLSFWYHMFGTNMGDLFIDVNDGDRWLNGIDVIRGQQHFQPTDRWTRHQIVLDSFVVNNEVRIRFRGDFLEDGGDIAIDDVELLDRAKKDARLDRVIDPDSDCDLTNAEDFKVRFQNVGTEDILETVLAYQITYTPYSCQGETVRPEVMDIVRDTLVGPLGFAAPLAFQEFEFDEIDMSSPGRYDFKIWTEVQGDVNFFNDTIYESRSNLTRGFDCCEDFSDMTYGQRGSTFRDATYPNGWRTTNGAYSFKPERNDGGITKGHSGRNNDVFFIAFDPDSPLPPPPARLISPCFDLTNADAAILEFYYQAPHPNHFMVIEAQDDAGGGGWTVLDTLRGEGLFGVQRWTKNTQVLTNFIGGFVNIRFTASWNATGFYAIDDICVKEPPPQQIDLERFVTPARGLCKYTDEEPITLRFQNVGRDRITDFKIVVKVDSAFQNFPPGQYLCDTFDVSINTNPFFDPGQKIDITLDLPEFYVDLLTPGIYWFNAEVLLDGDRDLENNIIRDYPINNLVPIQLPYIEDFELVKGEDSPDRGVTFRQQFYSNGITNIGGPYFWHEESGLHPDIESLTGPIVDHTKDSEEGTYMITNANAFQQGDIAIFFTRCIDLRDAISPELKYWYHMMGHEMGDLYVEINADGGWIVIDSLFGADPEQRTHRSPWKSRLIPLTDYKGSIVRLRWRSIRGGPGNAGSVAIDDISVIDAAAKDLSPISLAEPTSDTNSCYTENQKVTVNLRNNGSQPFDFTSDSVDIVVLIKKGLDVSSMIDWDTLYMTVHRNFFIRHNSSPPDSIPVPRDSIVSVTMPETFDMSDTGYLYRFIVDVFAQGDLINRNDRYITDVLSQRVGGFVGLSPDPSNRRTICFGSSVELKVRDHFGQVKWEEKLIRPDGTGEWFPGIFRPDDEREYVAQPDSTTEYRVRICGTEELSTTYTVNVIKPSRPILIRNGSRCGDSSVQVNEIPVRGEALVQNFATGLHIYDSVFHSLYPRGPEDQTEQPRLSPNKPGFSDTIPWNLKTSITDTLFLEAYVDTMTGPDPEDRLICPSLDKTTWIATIHTPPLPKFDLEPDTVCKDTAYFLDGGKVQYMDPDEDGNPVFYNTTYAWTIYLPDGSIVDTSNSDSSVLRNQTMVVDAYLLEKNKTYGYSLSMMTDTSIADGVSGCEYIGTGIKWITVVDSCVTTIEELSFKESFAIYPNPVTQDLYITHKSSENFKGGIKLMSVEGQIIDAIDNLGFGNLNHKIDMGTLPKGIYIIKIETEKGAFIEKIIKS